MNSCCLTVKTKGWFRFVSSDNLPFSQWLALFWVFNFFYFGAFGQYTYVNPRPFRKTHKFFRHLICVKKASLPNKTHWKVGTLTTHYEKKYALSKYVACVKFGAKSTLFSKCLKSVHQHQNTLRSLNLGQNQSTFQNALRVYINIRLM